ncbi:MAG: hypothetical protein KUG77_03825, partial [Nannocystaceae bacterium]|nr:hypothetical protein [Nannocystaceae bacterium]
MMPLPTAPPAHGASDKTRCPRAESAVYCAGPSRGRKTQMASYQYIFTMRQLKKVFGNGKEVLK